MKKLFVYLVVFSLCTFACTQSKYKDGRYIGVGNGHSGKIKVEVIVVKSKISHIGVLEYTDTPGISDEVFAKLPLEIIRSNSTDVDAISGATSTSRGVLQAVDDALSAAAKN